MKFNTPTQVTFIISLVLAAAAVLSRFVAIQNVSVNAFWILLIAYIALVIGGAKEQPEAGRQYCLKPQHSRGFQAANMTGTPRQC